MDPLKVLIRDRRDQRQRPLARVRQRGNDIARLHAGSSCARIGHYVHCSIREMNTG
jgi:hypothetical protein